MTSRNCRIDVFVLCICQWHNSIKWKLCVFSGYCYRVSCIYWVWLSKYILKKVFPISLDQSDVWYVFYYIENFVSFCTVLSPLTFLYVWPTVHKYLKVRHINCITMNVSHIFSYLGYKFSKCFLITFYWLFHFLFYFFKSNLQWPSAVLKLFSLTYPLTTLFEVNFGTLGSY